MELNIFNPIGVGVLYGLIAAFILGLIHGITPDEHTWPITFSYAIGNFSTKKGAETGLIFSLGFTAQRAAMAEVFYLIFAYGLSGIGSALQSSLFFALVYFVVGFVMGIAGYFIKHGKAYPHVEFNKLMRGKKNRFEHKKEDFYSKKIPNWMALIHGLIAGFGMGAFALIIFVVIVPQMPNAYLGFLPGAMFGVGTMVMQIIFGMAFGTVMRLKKLTKSALQFLARYISASVLLYGGAAFMIAGIVSAVFPQVLYLGISTGIGVYNLNSINIGFVLVIVVVGVIGILSYVNGMKIIRSKSARSSSRME